MCDLSLGKKIHIELETKVKGKRSLHLPLNIRASPQVV